jgi:uncharacterized delta-60 repeat protein
LQPDGKIVVAGRGYPGDPGVLSAFTLARYNPDGSLDTSFGTNGITNTVIAGDDGATAVAILPSGKILAAGQSDPGTGDPSSSFALAEYRSDGTLNPSFGADGIVQTSFTGDDQLAGIVVQPDGKIVATGAGFGLGHGQEVDKILLARFKPNGSLDPTFGTTGKVSTHPKLAFGGGSPALQHRKIIVAGYGPSLVLARYKANGRLDPIFGQHGFAKIGRITAQPSAILVQKDGKILVAAAHGAYYQQGNGVVIRLLPNGRLDTSFGTGGIVALGDEVSSLALQTDEKILVGGGSGNAWTLTRLIGGNS